MTIDEAVYILEVIKEWIELDPPLDSNVALDMAMEALEKQEPMETGDAELPIDETSLMIPCGNCGESLTDRMWGYCPWCGQKIDWEK